MKKNELITDNGIEYGPKTKNEIKSSRRRRMKIYFSLQEVFCAK